MSSTFIDLILRNSYTPLLCLIVMAYDAAINIFLPFAYCPMSGKK